MRILETYLVLDTSTSYQIFKSLYFIDTSRVRIKTKKPGKERRKFWTFRNVFNTLETDFRWIICALSFKVSLF